MNVWIFQDEPGKDMRQALRSEGVDHVWTWNVDRYVSATATPRVEPDDLVLQWQPYFDDSAPAGIYAVGKAICEPYYHPNEKSNWRVEVRITYVLRKPVTRSDLAQQPGLSSLLILRMAGGHIVFPVKPEEWGILKRMVDAL